MSTVSKHIKRLRQERGFSQEELGARLFVTRQTVSNWETGRSQPDIDTLVRLAEALDSEVTSLIYGPPIKPSRKKELRALEIVAALVVVLGLLLMWYIPYARQARAIFEIQHTMLIQVFLYPLLFVLIGWLLLQILFVLGVLKRPNRSRCTSVVFYVVLSILLLYVLLQIPYVLCVLLPSVESQGLDLWLQHPIGQFVSVRLFLFLANKLPLFFLPGLLLWLFWPQKTPPASPQAQTGEE